MGKGHFTIVPENIVNSKGQMLSHLPFAFIRSIRDIRVR